MTTIFSSNKSAKKRIIIGDNFDTLIFISFIFIWARIQGSEVSYMEIFVYFVCLATSLTVIGMRYYITEVSYNEEGVNFKYHKWLTPYEAFVSWADLKITIQQIAYVTKARAPLMVIRCKKKVIIQQRCKLLFENSDWLPDRLEEISKTLIELKKQYTK